LIKSSGLREPQAPTLREAHLQCVRLPFFLLLSSPLNSDQFNDNLSAILIATGFPVEINPL
jgi:hypothetical protein